MIQPSTIVGGKNRPASISLGFGRNPPRYDPYPKSYAAAAARLGWKRSTLVKRIEYLRTRLDAAGVRAHHVEGLQSGRWVLLDFVDVVVHLFHPEARAFYQLERLWHDAPRLATAAERKFP